MKEFFIDETINIPYKLFGKTHIFLLLIIILGCILIHINSKRLNNLKINTKKIITKTIAYLLFFNMLILYISSIYYDIFNYKDMLPLHLCYITNYVYIIAILLNKNKLLKYSYILSFIGPLPAIIFFNVPSMWESFNFYLYIISHHICLLGNFLTFHMYPKMIELKSIIKLELFLNTYYLIMSIFNTKFKTNYLFSKTLPEVVYQVIPILKRVPIILSLELTALIIILLLSLYYNKRSLLKSKTVI